MNYRELAKKLRSIGCREIRRRGSGSHRKWFYPTTGKGTTIPDWGHKDLKEGTISAIIDSLGLKRSPCDIIQSNNAVLQQPH